MTEELPAALTKEVVAEFADGAAFETAIRDLLAAGFARTDLSVLATHDSLEVAGDIAGYDHDPIASIRAGLAGEINWLAPLGIADILLVAGGPIGAVVAGVITAAAGLVALRPFFDQITESAHAEGFSQAIEAGRILLWVRTASADQVERAGGILAAAGGTGLVRLAKPAVEARQ